MADEADNRMSPYGPGANADETRQAQHSLSNDAPVDVNMNSIIAREQAGTFTLMGKNFEANANRLNVIANLLVQVGGIRPSVPA